MWSFTTLGAWARTCATRPTGWRVRATWPWRIPVEVEGIRYLVSPYGESDWVRNLRASGKATLARKGKVETVQASEIAVPGRAAIIAAYRKVCGRAVDPCFTKLPDPSDHPVFRVDEIGASSRA